MEGLDVKIKSSAKPVWWWLALIFHSQPSRFHPQPKPIIKRSGSVFNLRFSPTLLFGIGCVLMLTAVSAPASAQIVVKNDDVTLRFGFQGQLWADWTQDSSGAQNYQQNFYMRRARLIVGGDIGKDISFFVETDDPKLGITPKNLATGFVPVSYTHLRAHETVLDIV